MLILVHAPVTASDSRLVEVPISVERMMLAKRVWRGTAEDGQEFGFELSDPLNSGAVVFITDDKKYVVQQKAEAVLEISLAIASSAAAGIGWAVGNLHLELSAEPNRLLAADEPAARALLIRLGIPYVTTNAIFRPGRFARAAELTHDLGPSHRH